MLSYCAAAGDLSTLYSTIVIREHVKKIIYLNMIIGATPTVLTKYTSHQHTSNWSNAHCVDIRLYQSIHANNTDTN